MRDKRFYYFQIVDEPIRNTLWLSASWVLYQINFPVFLPISDTAFSSGDKSCVFKRETSLLRTNRNWIESIQFARRLRFKCRVKWRVRHRKAYCEAPEISFITLIQLNKSYLAAGARTLRLSSEKCVIWISGAAGKKINSENSEERIAPAHLVARVTGKLDWSLSGYWQLWDFAPDQFYAPQPLGWPHRSRPVCRYVLQSHAASDSASYSARYMLPENIWQAHKRRELSLAWQMKYMFVWRGALYFRVYSENCNSFPRLESRSKSEERSDTNSVGGNWETSF